MATEDGNKKLLALSLEQLGLGKHIGDMPEGLKTVFMDDGSVEVSSPMYSTGRIVKVRFSYGEGRFFEVTCNEYLAERMMHDVAESGGEWNPFRTFFDEWLIRGGYLTLKMIELVRARVVSGKILYSEIPEYSEHTPEELEAINRVRPDFETYAEREEREQVEEALKEVKSGGQYKPIFIGTLVNSNGSRINIKM